MIRRLAVAVSVAATHSWSGGCVPCCLLTGIALAL